MKNFIRMSGFLFLLVLIFASAALANWESETPLNVPRDQFTGGVIDGKIYVFGGNGNPNGINLKSCEVFDPATHLWSYCADNENNNGNGVEELTGGVVDGKLYVFGAYSGGGTGVINFVEEYAPATNTWTSKAPMPTTRTAGPAVVYNGEIYIFGGSLAGPDPRSSTNVVEAYNPATNLWRTNITPMPIALTSAAVAVVGNKAYVLGGGYRENGVIKVSNTVMVYDFLTDTWTANGYAPLPLPRGTAYSGAAPVIEGKIYLIGGMADTGTVIGVTNSVAIYDTVTNTWSSGPSLPVPTDDHLAVVLDNTIYVIGGDTDTNESVRTGAVWKWELPANPLLGKWGYGRLQHENNGTWGSEGGTITFNADGTGSVNFKNNDGGVLNEGVKAFTYSTILNTNGSISLTMKFSDRTELLKIVISDDGNMAVVDRTLDTDVQSMVILIRMDESKTYANADLNGEYYIIAYENNATYTAPPYGNGNNMAISSIGTFYGDGTYTYYGKANSDGTIWDDDGGNKKRAYSVNPDGSFTIGNGGAVGYLSEGEILGIVSRPGITTDKWASYFSMKKGDKVYSTADIAGTWAIAGFGDDNGNSFNAEFGSMTCDVSGNCLLPLRNQRDGTITYETLSATFSVASDGSFGDSVNPDIPFYAGAIGNNGNNIICNVSFDPGQSYHREIFIGVRCSDCKNLNNTGSIVINHDEPYTNSRNADLTIMADNENSPVKMCVSNTSESCSPWIPYVKKIKNWILSKGDGTKTVYVWFKDGQGNVSPEPYSDDILLDTKDTEDGVLAAELGNGEVLLGWSGFADADSGIAGYKLVYSTGNSPASCPEGKVLYTGADTSYSHSGLVNGKKYSYRVCAVDNAGNQSEGAFASIRFIPETDPPVCSIRINNDDSSTGFSIVNLGLSADDESPPLKMCLSNSNSKCSHWTNYAASKKWKLTKSDGTKTVYVWVKDKWGNTSSCSDDIVLDAD